MREWSLLVCFNPVPITLAGGGTTRAARNGNFATPQHRGGLPFNFYVEREGSFVPGFIDTGLGEANKPLFALLGFE